VTKALRKRRVPRPTVAPQNSGQDSRNQRGGHGEEEGSSVQANLVETGPQAHDVRRHFRYTEPQAKFREQKSRRGAKKRKQDAFRQHLAHEPRAASAKRFANSQLRAAGRGAGELQVGNVGAGHKQDDANDGEHQNGVGASDAAFDVFHQWQNVKLAVFVRIRKD